MNTAEILERAADALFVYGRCTGAGLADDGRMCVLGAINHAQGRDARRWSFDLFGGGLSDLSDPAGVALAGHLRANGGRDHCDLVYPWNDRLPVNPENDALVIDTLKACAKTLRNEGE